MKGLKDGYDGTQLLIVITGFIGLFSNFINLLYQNNLTFYFYWTRFKNWFRNYPAKWQLTVRYDGNFKTDPVLSIKNFLKELSGEANVKIHHSTVNSINFSVHETLNFYFDFQPKEINPFSYDTIDVSLAPFEIGSNDSRQKLNTKIVPILSKLQTEINPENTSYVLDISFIKGNPFFNIFLSHVNSAQIDSFTINLQLSDYSSQMSKDYVTINKENVVLNANNLHSLKELANDFIYLSSNAKRYIKASTHG